MKRREFLGAAIAGASATSNAFFPKACAGQSTIDPAEKMLVIDAHCHAGRGKNFGQPEEVHEPWTTFNDPEESLRKMDEAGIDRTVIFPISNTTYEAANKEIAEYVQRWPDKFIGFAKHDSKTEEGRIAEMLRLEVRDLGLSGLKLHGTPTEEMMKTAAELEIPILFHPRRVDDCHLPVRSHPEVNFILAHLGSFASRDWQEHVRAIEATEQYPNLYLETSSVVFFRYLELAAKVLPTGKLIFGTDGPLVDSRLEIKKIRMLRLDPAAEQQVLGGNMLSLLSRNRI